MLLFLNDADHVVEVVGDVVVFGEARYLDQEEDADAGEGVEQTNFGHRYLDLGVSGVEEDMSHSRDRHTLGRHTAAEDSMVAGAVVGDRIQTDQVLCQGWGGGLAGEAAGELLAGGR